MVDTSAIATAKGRVRRMKVFKPHKDPGHRKRNMIMSPDEVKELKKIWEDDSIPWNQHIDSEICYDVNCQVHEVKLDKNEWLELRNVKEPCWSFTWSGCYDSDYLHYIREKILFKWWLQQPETPCRFDYWTECNIDECQHHLPNKRAMG